MISVLLADDHHLVRRGFRRMLEDDPDIRVVGEASDGDETLRLALETQPDVVVMDAAMPGGGGIAATRTIVEQLPGTFVLMLSMHSEQTVVQQAMAAGARGYVLKNAIDLDLASAVRRVAAGETVLDPVLARPASPTGQRTRLTPRELDVLRLICDGLSNKQIAAKLQVSVNTVGVHRANIMNALGIHKTAELVVYALQNGLVNPL
jgi:DNA-binding NarL/FixJ family response regulator